MSNLHRKAYILCEIDIPGAWTLFWISHEVVMLSVLSKLQELGKEQFWEIRALKEKSIQLRACI